MRTSVQETPNFSGTYLKPDPMCENCPGMQISEGLGQVQFQDCVAFLMRVSSSERAEYSRGIEGWEELAADQANSMTPEDAERSLNCFENKQCRKYHKLFNGQKHEPKPNN